MKIVTIGRKLDILQDTVINIFKTVLHELG